MQLCSHAPTNLTMHVYTHTHSLTYIVPKLHVTTILQFKKQSSMYSALMTPPLNPHTHPLLNPTPTHTPSQPPHTPPLNPPHKPPNPHSLTHTQRAKWRAEGSTQETR